MTQGGPTNFITDHLYVNARVNNPCRPIRSSHLSKMFAFPILWFLSSLVETKTVQVSVHAYDWIFHFHCFSSIAQEQSRVTTLVEMSSASIRVDPSRLQPAGVGQNIKLCRRLQAVRLSRDGSRTIIDCAKFSSLHPIN